MLMQFAPRFLGGLYLFMTVDVDQWRASGGSFCSSRTEFSSFTPTYHFITDYNLLHCALYGSIPGGMSN